VRLSGFVVDPTASRCCGLVLGESEWLVLVDGLVQGGGGGTDRVAGEFILVRVGIPEGDACSRGRFGVPVQGMDRAPGGPVFSCVLRVPRVPHTLDARLTYNDRQSPISANLGSV
jgi:hypothetical protein